MAALKIQYKLFAAMFAWSALLILVLVVSIQESLDAGMIDYVNQKEIESLAPMLKELRDDYLLTGNWSQYEEHTDKFRQLLGSHLFDTRFAPPGQLRPPPRRPHNEGAYIHSGNRPERRGPPPGYGESRNNELTHDVRRPPRPAHLRPDDMPMPRGTRGPNDGSAPRPLPMVSYVLLDRHKKLIAGIYPPDRDYTFVEIKPLDEVVGYLAVSKRSLLAEGYELRFLDRQQDQLILVGSILLVVTFLLTLPFARHLVQPIRTVARSLSQLSKGDYKTSLSTERHDEFQLLFQNINNLAKTLAENEQARQKWFADTAHDLRTPIAIMRGELEAMLDGVRKLDREQVESIHGETLRLQRFINDLHELARSELGTQHYEKMQINLCEVIGDAAQHCSQMLAEHQIHLETQLPESPLLYLADEFRLAQCLDNLLSNIANYAHNATVAKVSLTPEKEHILIKVEDDGIGVSEEHLPKLFDHLYRVEGSRNRNTGGSGLGLAICRNIVEAHNGVITAEKSDLGGLAILIAFPATEASTSQE